MIRDQVRGVYGIDERDRHLMRVYLRYAVKETLTNLWRNRMMTIAAVLTVAVSLSLVGSALLLKQSAAQASVAWQQGTRVDGLDAADGLAERDQRREEPAGRACPS